MDDREIPPKVYKRVFRLVKLLKHLGYGDDGSKRIRCTREDLIKSLVEVEGHDEFSAATLLLPSRATGLVGLLTLYGILYRVERRREKRAKGKNVEIVYDISSLDKLNKILEDGCRANRVKSALKINKTFQGNPPKGSRWEKSFSLKISGIRDFEGNESEWTVWLDQTTHKAKNGSSLQNCKIVSNSRIESKANYWIRLSPGGYFFSKDAKILKEKRPELYETVLSLLKDKGILDALSPKNSAKNETKEEQRGEFKDAENIDKTLGFSDEDLAYFRQQEIEAYQEFLESQRNVG